MKNDLSKQFQLLDYVFVKNFIDLETINFISKYMENKLRRGEWDVEKRDKNDFISKYVCYSDPLVEVILEKVCPIVSDIVGKELFPTYSYARIYTDGDELKKHVDRPSCEISLTVSVAYKGNKTPIFLLSPKTNDAASYILDPGDAIIYKGCEVFHWREPIGKEDIVVQFMLHYVDKYGKFKNYKFDNREDVGYLKRN